MATVGERYQIVIERDARVELGVRPGDRAIETVERGRLVVTFVPGPHRRSLVGRLAGRGRISDFADYREKRELGDELAGEDQAEENRLEENRAGQTEAGRDLAEDSLAATPRRP